MDPKPSSSTITTDRNLVHRDPEAILPSMSRRWFFAFFFISGLCSVLYEIVWLRLAMSQFGVTTAMVSIVLSMFMAGLGIGSWQGGKFIRRHTPRSLFTALRLYGVAEILIGFSSIAVRSEFSWGRGLLHLALSPPYRLPLYYLLAGIWMMLTLVPWCACMGATFPFAMRAVQEQTSADRGRSFSYLYLANVLGAMVGTWAPLFLIELVGFRSTLGYAGVLNLALGATAWTLSSFRPQSEEQISTPPAFETDRPRRAGPEKLLLLFATGLTSMAMEVLWVRIYTPTSGTVVYTFARILGYYLLATYLGSAVYRKWGAGARFRSGLLWVALGFAGVLPIMTADPRLHLSSTLRVLLGILVFTGLLGFITPLLVDQASGGDPDTAGKAYAVNVFGCILGPLLSGFILLPLMSERASLFLVSSLWLVVGVIFHHTTEPPRTRRTLEVYGMIVASILVAYRTEGYGERLPVTAVLRDSTATVMALGQTRSEKHLLVNGIGITGLTPITKIMAHLPLAYLGHPPDRALDICFGMGTTFRSLMSWGIQVDAAELVPSVPRLFNQFHSDADQVLASSRAHVIIDDGRRYLEWTPEKYDLITIDPPPPVEAAGSSLLYSKEFYALAKQRLQPGGIMAQWLPGGDPETRASVAKALQESFPYVRAFGSLHGWGVHYLASSSPLPERTAAELASRLPAAAAADLIEWGPFHSAEKEFAAVLDRSVNLDELIAGSPATPAMTDNRPINEYYSIRRFRHRRQNRNAPDTQPANPAH
jgi:spermidine synthase